MDNWVLYINIRDIWQVVSLWKKTSHLKAMEKLFPWDRFEATLELINNA